MATHRFSISASATPDTSGKVTIEPATILDTSDKWGGQVIRIDEDYTNATQLSTKAGVYCGFMVPKNYVSTPKIIVVHYCTKTAGAIVFDADYKPVAAGETLDPAALNTTDTANTTVPGTAYFSKELSITLAAEALAVDDYVRCYIARDGADATDTLAGASLIQDILFEYADA